VQQDEATGGHVVAADLEVAAQGVRERRDPLGRGDLVDDHLGTHRCGQQLLQGSGERWRGVIELAAGAHRPMVGTPGADRVPTRRR
jgi:hypothetical protein